MAEPFVEVCMSRLRGSGRRLLQGGLLLIFLGTILADAQGPAQQQEPSQSRRPGADPPLWPADEAYIRATLPQGEGKYAWITGPHIKSLLKESTLIPLKYREEGHQYWGQITGLPTDAVMQKWVLDQFRRIGLDKVRIQNLDLSPQWVPQSFEASVKGGGREVQLKSIFPIFGTVGTPSEGSDLEPVWVGLGTAADFMGRQIKGKAVLIYSIPTPGGRNHSAQWNGAIERAERGGAGAVIVVMGIPGNVMSQPGGEGGPGGTTSTILHMTIGSDDGNVVREMIEQGKSPVLHLKLDVKLVPGLKTANVWGELPGMGDENILIMAHDDWFFQGALDNASGMAGLLTLAEYFARVPKEQRPRTLIFLITPGHHAGSPGAKWVHENRATVLTKTALILNCEHFAQTQTYWLGSGLMASNTVGARRWFVGGSASLKQLATKTFQNFGVALYSRPEVRPGGELSQVYMDAPCVHIIDHVYYHTDMDVPELVPEAGLENSVRAYAKIIDEVNQMNIKDLR